MIKTSKAAEVAAQAIQTMEPISIIGEKRQVTTVSKILEARYGYGHGFACEVAYEIIRAAAL